MKNNHIFFSLLVTGFAAATFAILSNVVFPEALRADKMMAALYSVGMFLFAVRDYSGRTKTLTTRPAAPMLRPVPSITIDARPHRARTGSRVACVQQGAA